MKTKLLACLFLVAATGVVLGLSAGCKSGREWAACMDTGLAIYPPAGGGEFLLTEVASLAICLGGILIALLAYANGDPRRLRIAVVFLMLFVTAFVGENNLMRDDLRAQFLMVLLVWLGIELLLRRDILPIGVLILGCAIAFAGSLNDHTMHIQFRNLFGTDIADSVLAPVQQLSSNNEESTEFIGWLFFLFAGLKALDIRCNRRQTTWFFVLVAGALLAVTIGNAFLHLRQTETLEGARKLGFFCSVAGVALVAASARIGYPSSHASARAHCATLTVAAWLLFVFAPAVYTHEHSKTVSSWTWIIPLLVMHYDLITQRRAFLRQTGTDDTRAAGTHEPHAPRE